MAANEPGPRGVKDAETRRRLRVFERATWGPHDPRIGNLQAERVDANYVEKSPYADRNCGTCLHFIPEGSNFGVCTRVKGLIEQAGYSDHYAPLTKGNR